MEDDFGFSAVSKTEIFKPDERVNEMANATIAFVNKLMENPEKDYIFWPDRVKKLNEFKKKIKNIQDRK